ncbi:MAG: rpsP [Bacteriovoracaceae bacterium]|nr:rpsP [Bacteriovoracaceae bacterium]
MAVKLRLTRTGTKKRPFYRLMATDSRSPQGGKHLEILGTYDPMNLSVPKNSSQKEDKGIVNFKTDRVKYWLSVGAETSPTVKILLKRLKITEAA